MTVQFSADGRILGTYVHGLFDRKEACDALLRWAGLEAPTALDTKPCAKPG